MADLLEATYNIVGMDLEQHATTVQNLLDATAGIVDVDIDFKKAEARLTSTVPVEIEKLEAALADTDFYITPIREINWVAAPSMRKAAARARIKHNSSRNIEGVSDGTVDTGPRPDYDRD